ncbi:hypothetical protein ACERIT_12305 [Halopenitus sp. H-Gu1]|uniref:hypothetical protein n=1 Tax=Halopenitus sp. H-Gu1 TaxID=3242697 RepID=UPI00359EA8BB
MRSSRKVGRRLEALKRMRARCEDHDLEAGPVLEAQIDLLEWVLECNETRPAKRARSDRNDGGEHGDA